MSQKEITAACMKLLSYFYGTGREETAKMAACGGSFSTHSSTSTFSLPLTAFQWQWDFIPLLAWHGMAWHACMALFRKVEPRQPRPIHDGLW